MSPGGRYVEGLSVETCGFLGGSGDVVLLSERTVSPGRRRIDGRLTVSCVDSRDWGTEVRTTGETSLVGGWWGRTVTVGACNLLSTGGDVGFGRFGTGSSTEGRERVGGTDIPGVYVSN